MTAADDRKSAVRRLKEAAADAWATFLRVLPCAARRRMRERVRYVTVGLDSENERTRQHIELVAVYGTADEKTIAWTGKSYPVKWQEHLLLRMPLESHLVKLRGVRALVLGCHDLNLFSPRAWANAKGWRHQMMCDFGKMVRQFGPAVVLHHPHRTDSPRIWLTAWSGARKLLPGMSVWASAIRYRPTYGDLRAPLTDTLRGTAAGNVLSVRARGSGRIATASPGA